MLTEILIKPFLDDLEHQGIKDTTPYEQGFMAGMAALSSILSEHVDNKAQLFVYLGMAISEGMQWVESQVSESPEKPHPIEFVSPRYHAGSEIDNLTPVFPGTKEFIPQLHDARWIEPNDDFVGFNCYGLAAFNAVCKGVLNRTAEGTFYIYQYGGYEFGVEKIIPLESPNEPRERHPTPSEDTEENEWDYIPTHNDLPTSLIQKYAKKEVFFAFVGDLDQERKGKAILDLSSNRLQVIDMSGNQVKRPYYIRLR